MKRMIEIIKQKKINKIGLLGILGRVGLILGRQKKMPFFYN